MAEVEGFEPPDCFQSLAFKASAFGRSATLPRPRATSADTPMIAAAPAATGIAPGSPARARARKRVSRHNGGEGR